MPTVKINVSTVTPLWTGNAWGRYKQIQPQSILGSLRFWFEVLCYASHLISVKSYKTEKLDYDNFKSEVNDVLKNSAENSKKNITLFEIKRRALRKLSFPSQIFGCNGWKGFVKIKKIELANYLIPNNPLDLRNKITKESNNGRKPSEWYYEKPYFWGDFYLELELESNELKETIVYPLLHFIEKYGFVGGKNNLGYGRVKFEIKGVNLEEYDKLIFKEYPHVDFSKIVNKNIIKFDDLLEENLVQDRQIGLYVKEKNRKSSYKQMIEELIRYKSDRRTKLNNKEKRHYIFGSTKRDEYKSIEGPNATKIIPWIDKIADDTYQYGYISLRLLQGFPREVS